MKRHRVRISRSRERSEIYEIDNLRIDEFDCRVGGLPCLNSSISVCYASKRAGVRAADRRILEEPMKRLGFLVLAITVIGVACDDDNGVSPSTQPMDFSALLSPANENPPISNVENSGSGAAQVTILATRDSAGRITAATAN